MAEKHVFEVTNGEGGLAEKEGIKEVLCNLPFAYFAGKNALADAEKLAEKLNKAFAKIYPEIAESMQAADILFAEGAKRKVRNHMYSAIRAVLETQRDAGQGTTDWSGIYNHPDFNFPFAAGTVLAKRPINMSKVRKAIQGGVRYLQSKGVDVEITGTPGNLQYSLC